MIFISFYKIKSKKYFEKFLRLNVYTSLPDPVPSSADTICKPGKV